METLIGSSLAVFLGLTVVLFGGAAYLTGQSRARTWKSFQSCLLYVFILAVFNRFLVFALFKGELLSPLGFLASFIVILVFCSLGYTITKANKMVGQYPWLYVRSGPFSWREKA